MRHKVLTNECWFKREYEDITEQSRQLRPCDVDLCRLLLVLPSPRFLELWFGQIFRFSFLIILNLCFESVLGQAKPCQQSRCCEMDEATLFNVVAFDNEGNLEVLCQSFSRSGHHPSCVTRVSPLRFNASAILP